MKDVELRLNYIGVTSLLSRVAGNLTQHLSMDDVDSINRSISDCAKKMNMKTINASGGILCLEPGEKKIRLTGGPPPILRTCEHCGVTGYPGSLEHPFPKFSNSSHRDYWPALCAEHHTIFVDYKRHYDVVAHNKKAFDFIMGHKARGFSAIEIFNAWIAAGNKSDRIFRESQRSWISSPILATRKAENAIYGMAKTNPWLEPMYNKWKAENRPLPIRPIRERLTAC